MYIMALAFILFPVVWLPVCISLISIVLPEFKIPITAAIVICLVIPAVQICTSLYAIPVLLKSLGSLIFLPFLNYTWQEKLQIILRNWALWIISTGIGYGLIVGILWLVKSLPLGMQIGNDDNLNNLFLAALILQWLPQAAQENLAKPLVTPPFSWRSALTVIIAIITFPLVPIIISQLSNNTPYSGLYITPISAAVVYALYHSILAIWQSILKPIKLTWTVLFPTLSNLENFTEGLPSNIQWLFAWTLFTIGLTIGIIPLWLATTMITNLQISYPIGLVTFIITATIGSVIHSAITSLTMPKQD